MYRNWSWSTYNPAAQDCASLHRMVVLCVCTTVVQLGDTLDILGTFLVQSFCERNLCFSASLTRQHIWEGTLGPNEMLHFSVQYSNIQSQEKQFCDPASLVLFKRQKKPQIKPKLMAKDVSSSYRFLVRMHVLNSYQQYMTFKRNRMGKLDFISFSQM